jgi:hypothetical protein
LSEIESLSNGDSIFDPNDTTAVQLNQQRIMTTLKCPNVLVRTPNQLTNVNNNNNQPTPTNTDQHPSQHPSQHQPTPTNNNNNHQPPTSSHDIPALIATLTSLYNGCTPLLCPVVVCEVGILSMDHSHHLTDTPIRRLRSLTARFWV